jgi:hypothetical protein
MTAPERATHIFKQTFLNKSNTSDAPRCSSSIEVPIRGVQPSCIGFLWKECVGVGEHLTRHTVQHRRYTCRTAARALKTRSTRAKHNTAQTQTHIDTATQQYSPPIIIKHNKHRTHTHTYSPAAHTQSYFSLTHAHTYTLSLSPLA